MKRIVTVILLAFVLSNAFGHNYGSSVLSLRLNDNSFFTLSIDGQQLSGATPVATLSNIMPGNHYIEVYKVVNNCGYPSEQLAYSGYVGIGINTEAFVTIDVPCQKLIYTDVIALNNYPDPHFGHYGDYYYGNGHGHDYMYGGHNSAYFDNDHHGYRNYEHSVNVPDRIQNNITVQTGYHYIIR
jgi:hypothetical protein